MTKNVKIQKKRFYNANRKRMQRRIDKEKIKSNERIFKVKNNSSFDSLNENQTYTENESTDIFHDKLKKWALQYNVRAYCLGDLLKMLTEVGIPFLPDDPATFLATPKSIEIENIANGQFWYSGVTKKLTDIFQTIDQNMEVKLNFHVDGLQLFKSSNKQFWPILAQIHG